MSDYSKINLLEVESSSKESDPVKSHFGRKHLDSKDLGISMFKYAPNHQSEHAHKHKVQEEAYLVAQGSGKILLGDEVLELKQWDVVRVAPEVSRSFESGPDGMLIIAVGGPKPVEGDGVMEKPNWPSN